MAGLDNVIKNLKAVPGGKFTGGLAIMMVSIAGLMILFSWLNKADFQVLYSNLSNDDVASIVEELKQKKIPYQLGGSGAVLVASDRIHELRIQFASQGLPEGGGVGFEIFDNTGFTTSKFVQKLNFKRAMEGELSRTIRSLSVVDQSRVHLVIPDKSVFAFQQNMPKASAAVFVTLKQGRKLNNKEVEGIVHLVSSSVEDLGPDDITVVDNKGTLLTRPSGDTAMSMSGSHMEYQQSYEKNLMAKIVGILEPVVGFGKVKAKVSTSFDFTRSERTEEIYDPEGVVVRSEQISSEKTTSGATGAGIPGAATNLPGGAGVGQGGSGSSSQKSDEVINYETSKTIKRVVDSPVTLERLTVAILIDGLMPAQEATVENPEQYVKRSEDDVKFYQDIVRKTIGFSEDRGDEISVTVMPFTPIEVAEMAEPETELLPIVMMVLKYLIPAIIAILFFMIVIRPLMKSVTRPVPQPAPVLPTPEEAAALEEPLKKKEIPMEKQVIDWAAGNPQEAAGLVKGWLEE